MTPVEARAFVTWFRNNHLPKGSDFVQTNSGREIKLDELNDDDAVPEPEPFGWVKIDEVRQHFDTAGCGTIYKTGGEGRVPLYTAPPKPEPMIETKFRDKNS